MFAVGSHRYIRGTTGPPTHPVWHAAGMTEARLERGWAALDACDWETARSEFQRALSHERSAEALRGLGQAQYWLGDYPASLAVLEEAFTAHRRRGDQAIAGRIATQLALLHGLVDGNASVVSGWVRHAERSLEDGPDGVETGWLALLRACFTSDPDVRARCAEEAIATGRRFGDAGVEFDGVAYLGKAHVERGRLDVGMPLIDEAVAAVSSGLVTDPWATAEILCTLFHTCELAVDLRRAEDWLGVVDDHVERTGERPTYGICRMHYGGLLTAAGRWTDAERELLSALAIYDEGYRGARAEVVLRLADLRARQGRLEEAGRLLEGYEDLPEAAVPRARLLLAEGSPEVAAAIVRRHRTGGEPVPLAAASLALLVEAELLRGELEAADEIAREFAVLEAGTEHPLVRGLAALSAARVSAARDDAAAVVAYERALAELARGELPCERGHAHLELARLVAEHRPEVARAEARTALACFDQVGATSGADAALALLRQLGDRSRPRPRTAGELTERETQVLDLVRVGRSNADIAARLHLSVRTVEHHVGSILAKLGAANRTEAAASAARSGATPTAGRQ